MLIYMDDMIIPATTEQEALERLKEVLQLAADYGLQIKWKKCKLLQPSIEYLGFIIKNGTVQATQHKIKAVIAYKPLTNAKEVQRFLGLTGYFRRFIQNYASIAKPLSDLLPKNRIFQYEREQHEAFEKLK